MSAPPPGVPPGGARGWRTPGDVSGPPGGYGVGLPPGVAADYGQRGGAPAVSGLAQEPYGQYSAIVGVSGLMLTFCCSLLGIVTGVVAVVLGVASLQRTRAEPERYARSSLAVIGIITGALSLLYFAVTLLFVGLGLLPTLLGKGP